MMVYLAVLLSPARAYFAEQLYELRLKNTRTDQTPMILPKYHRGRLPFCYNLVLFFSR
jgi:hypothetical protein